MPPQESSSPARTRLLSPGLFVPQSAVGLVYGGWFAPDPVDTIQLCQHQLGATTHLREAFARMIMADLVPALRPKQVIDGAGHSLGALTLAACVGLCYTLPSQLHRDFRAAAKALQDLEVRFGRVALVSGPWTGHGLARLIDQLVLFDVPIRGIRCLCSGSRAINEIYELLRPIAVCANGPEIWSLHTRWDGLLSEKSTRIELLGVRRHVVAAPPLSHFRPNAGATVRDVNAVCDGRLSRATTNSVKQEVLAA